MPGKIEAADAEIRRLAAHGFEVEVQPDCGGRIVSLRYQGEDVFQPDLAPGRRRILDAGCFPLVPFSNRIRNRRFSFAGRTYELAPNWDGDGNAIHGEGWTSSWTVTQQDDQAIRLWMSGRNWWPWDYECSQLIRLEPNRIILSLNLTNLDSAPMPAGLGFHPYFPRHADTELQFSASGIVPPMGEQMVAIEPLTPATDFSSRSDLEARDLDHCYAGWSGVTTIRQPSQSLEITLRTSRKPAAAVVYIPPHAPFFCFEPVTHLTGAFEMDPSVNTGLEQLKPGQSLDLSVIIDVRDFKQGQAGS